LGSADWTLESLKPSNSGSHTVKFKYDDLKLSNITSEVANMLIVKAKIKEAVGEANVASDFAEALDKKVEQLIKDAVERAKGNNRRTVMAKDL